MHTRGLPVGSHSGEGGQVAAEVVALLALERLEETGRPVGAGDLVRIVKERPEVWPAVFRECAVKAAEMHLQRRLVEVIDHIPLAARCSALDLLAGPARKHGVDRPDARWRRPVQLPIGIDARREVADFSSIAVRHRGLQRRGLTYVVVLHGQWLGKTLAGSQ